MLLAELRRRRVARIKGEQKGKASKRVRRIKGGGGRKVMRTMI